MSSETVSEDREVAVHLDTRYRALLPAIAGDDVSVLSIKDAEYGASWKRRGGAGAFMMLARKWDRLEEAVQRASYDVFAAALSDGREEGVLDDIADLRRYLLLVEAEVRVRQRRT
ncbi:MAG TPA: hypothetical protein DCP69_01685 [Candidatus Omnitrophica bacterium]|nr:hypothetical protein [Candidatus Omnitrophota bacterium]